MKKQSRILALVMAALFVFSCASAALAFVGQYPPGTSVVTKADTYIYVANGNSLQQSNKMLAAGTRFNIKDHVQIQNSSSSWFVALVRDSSGSVITAYIPADAVVIGNASNAPATGSTVGSSAGVTWNDGTGGSGSTSGSGTGTATGTTSGTVTGSTANKGTPGTIVNVTSGVNFRQGAGTGYSALGVIPKGATVYIQGSTTGSDGKTWYKLTYGTTTGYVHSKYVSATGSVTGGTTTSGSASSGYTAYSAAKSMVSNDKTIYMRKTPNASTSSSNVVKKLTGVKGKTFSILGEVGTWYFASYGSYQGYVRQMDFSAASSSGTTSGTTSGSTGGAISGGSLGAGMSYAKVTGGSADVWGSIYAIPGTNIGSAYGKLYDNNIYCNGLNSKGTDYYYNAYSGKKNYFFSLSPLGSETAVISGHNMRQSKTGFNNLHNLQNEYLRGNTSNSKFYINFAGKSQWQVVGFFELNEDTLRSESTRKSLQQQILLNFSATGAAKQSWLNGVLGYANSTYKGGQLSTASSSDKLMVIYTCGDYGNGAGRSAGGYQNLYFILKAVG